MTTAKELRELIKEGNAPVERSIIVMAENMKEMTQSINELIRDREVHEERFRHITVHQDEQDKRIDGLEGKVGGIQETVTTNKVTTSIMWGLGASLVGSVGLVVKLFYDMFRTELHEDRVMLIQALQDVIKVMSGV